ncbi:Uncharacterised protein [Serratia ficaria]|nr:Uncharacterised protein [Serratia ficaria]CAI1976189.1 Uncharacterised protein [Serratia ficaria]
MGKIIKETTEQVQDANASLIAAAPELLEALIQARVFVAGWHAKYDLEESAEALKACNYAINKALEVSDE